MRFCYGNSLGFVILSQCERSRTKTHEITIYLSSIRQLPKQDHLNKLALSRDLIVHRSHKWRITAFRRKNAIVHRPAVGFIDWLDVMGSRAENI